MKKTTTIMTRCMAAVLATAWLAVSVSCVNPKEVVYLQDIQGKPAEALTHNYQTTIQKDDQLSVSVSSKQPELTAPFAVSEMGLNNQNNTQNQKKGYLVDAQGDIVLPIIGKMHAAGKTCTQLSADIAAALRNNDYIRDASVNVQIMNFKFSVLGEVSSPGVYNIEGQRITIFEAISKAGDLNIDGERDVTIIREKNGKREFATLDLRSKDIFNSPYYYIQQNDVLYVRPSTTAINARSETMQIVGWSGAALGLVGAIIAIACA